ncbi:MAG: hypothetical protein AB7I42_30475 [Bradyrhizobium sp.]|uniref:hypothetical protein n=1 Tax=Bradyrhizobium sp. TaxID=376 RepID=UPI003D0A3FE6
MKPSQRPLRLLSHQLNLPINPIAPVLSPGEWGEAVELLATLLLEASGVVAPESDDDRH